MPVYEALRHKTLKVINESGHYPITSAAQRHLQICTVATATRLENSGKLDAQVATTVASFTRRGTAYTSDFLRLEI